MRVLRLPLDGHRALDLHPCLSVVTGLGAEEARAVRAAVASVAAGLAPAGGGLLEAHGLLLDAAPRDLDLLDPRGGSQPVVVTHAGLRGPAPGDDERLDRLRSLEGDARRLAEERRDAAASRDAARRRADPGERDRVRVEQLRLALGRHEATDVEPLRRALDADRDARRAGAEDPAAVAAVVDELAELGVDLRGLDLDSAEVRQVADDLVDEHRRRASWAVGARVELDGLERRLAEARAATGRGAPPAPAESDERREAWAGAELAAALDRVEQLRDEIAAAGCVPPLPADELEAALLRLFFDRRRDQAAGTVPVLLDRVLAPLDEAQVGAVLDRLWPLSRSVQVVVVDDHPAAIAWAGTAGGARAALVSAPPAPPAPPSPTMPPTPT